jgi:RNA polymerase sigma factor (sigma-70 family)
MAAAAPEIPVLARNQAFETLYRRYVADVYHYALALLRNPADAEDVTQTTFLNAYRAYQSGVEIAKPQNWLIKIAHNVARSRYARASRRVKEVPLEDHVEQLALPDDDRPNIDALLRALWRLPFNQRAALVMRELEGRTYVEIADTIGVSVSAVETLIFRARKSMRTKASAVRTLATVPLPTSLTKLFGGGGVVAGSGSVAAGGGGALGIGLLVKTGAALVAGLVATGIITDRSTPADAAHHEAAPAAASAGPVRSGSARRQVRVLDRGRLTGRVVEVVQANPLAGSDTAKSSGLLVSAQSTGRTQTPSSLAQSSSLPASPLSSNPAPAVTTQATDLVSTVQSAASSPLPNLPVQTPTVPTLPVTVPQLPVGTPLP